MEWVLGAVIGVVGGFIFGVWQGLSKAKKVFTEEYFLKKYDVKIDSNVKVENKK